MIPIISSLWVGDSSDQESYDRCGAQAILNVAQDLPGRWCWPRVEYMQVGLVDGPGNGHTAYMAAVVALADMVRRKRTLVCCHTGSRAFAVAIMYLHVLTKRRWYDIIQMISVDNTIEVPNVHNAHREAFEEIPWKVVREVIK